MLSPNVLQVLNSLSLRLLSIPPLDFLHEVALKAAESLSASSCIVWKWDKQGRRLRVVAATSAVDDLFKTELYIDDSAFAGLLSQVEIGFSEGSVTSLSGDQQQEKSRRGRTVTVPIVVKNELLGVMEVHSESGRLFTADEKALIVAFAYQAAAAFQKIELYQEKLTDRQRFQELSYKIGTPNDLEALLGLLLESALGLVNSQRGWIGLLNPLTGYLEVVTYRGNPLNHRALMVREGIIGTSTGLELPFNTGDVSAYERQGVLVPFWSDSRSVVAVPILITNAMVRIGTSVESRGKFIGTLNLESTAADAFSEEDSEQLQSLARLAAIQIDRLGLEHKLNKLRTIVTEIVGTRSYDETVETLMRGIIETLNYDFVNISIVVPEINCLRSEYTAGIPEEKIADFKKLSVHPLDGQDVQADIVRTRNIEVLVDDDPRLDGKIFDRFSQRDLVRVILPMIVQADGRVIGTLEAGYRRTSYRQFIYEQDIEILQGFLNYAVQALDQRDKRLLEIFSHEFRAPLMGLRSNVDFLRRRFKELPKELIDLKFRDMDLDCEILLQEVETLEYFLGRRPPTSTLQDTLVGRDIIIKTLNQLRPLIAERGLDTRKIQLDPTVIGKVRVDQRKLSQVFYNLLINAIKYAEADPQLFTIRISVDQNRDFYFIGVKDWGIGVERGMEEKIFEQGFRGPRAAAKDLIGTGLGLAIARSIMREMGGELTLINRYKPTEFQVRLPKNQGKLE